MDPTSNSSVSFFYNPDRVIKKFEEFFSYPKNQGHIDDLYYLFGAVNFEKVQSLLSSSLQDKMKQRSREIEKRFRIIWSQFLHSLKNQGAITQQLIEKACLYQNSAFGGADPRHLMIHELSRYFLSRPMPLQESKMLGCYEIRELKEEVDKKVEDLKRIVKGLFRLGARRMDPALQQLTADDYYTMYRSKALMFQSKQNSWGELLYLWAKANGNAMVVSIIENSFAWNKLLINTAASLPLMPQGRFKLSFKQFVIQSTLYLFFKSPTALLPDVESIRLDLEETFTSAISDEGRENSVYYLDSMALWLGEEFPFAIAYKALQSLQTVQEGCVYNFLHAVMHYFHALSVLKIKKTPECKKILLEAIYAVPLKNRKEFDKKIAGETYFQAGFLLDEFTRSFLHAHAVPLERWGEAFLRFSQTPHTSTPGPYLSAKEHLVFVQKIEDFIGLSLPVDLIADLFFFQKIKKGAIELVESFEAFRQTVFDHYLEAISIPKMNLSALQNLLKKFVEHFQSPSLIFEDDATVYKNRNDQFLRNASRLTSILQMMLNPKSFVLLEDSIPESIDRIRCKDIRVSTHGPELQLFDPHYPTGPLWMGRWQTRGKDIYYSITIMNSLQSMRTCTFWLQLPTKLFDHLSLIKQHVDNNSSIEFVRVLRTLFLKCFYQAMLDKQAPKDVSVPELAMLYPFEDGFILKTDEVRYSIYSKPLSKIYADWKLSEDDEFICGDGIADGLLSLRIDQEDKAQETVWVSWTLHLENGDRRLTLKYSHFEDENDFIRMMVWQIALLKQDCLSVC